MQLYFEKELKKNILKIMHFLILLLVLNRHVFHKQIVQFTLNIHSGPVPGSDLE